MVRLWRVGRSVVAVLPFLFYLVAEASETTLPIVFAGNLPNGGPFGLKCIRGAGSGATGTGSLNPKVVYVEASAVRAASLG